MHRSLVLLTSCLLPLLLTGSSRARPSTDSKDSRTPKENLEVGALEGVYLGPGEEPVAFLGVPYAAPPIGELRWKPPQPMRGWQGTRKATAYGASCPQLPQGWLPELPWNEDCLFLNVYAPRLVSKTKRPVIVWFHGGSNTAGRSEETVIGPAFARRGGVVVSFNFRLGPFGFLAHPALTAESENHASGDYGLLDQLQALKWTRENISRFGGDPDRITVVGHSAGAFDICLLMASPLAVGLFERAILESGECQSGLARDLRLPLPYDGLQVSGEAEGQRLAADLHVVETPDASSRLRRIPADEILNAWSKDSEVRFDAIVDGWVIPEQPARTFAEGRQAHIPIIVGSTADEATVFVGHQHPTTIEQYRAKLAAESGKHAVQVFQAYPATSDGEVAAQYVRFQTDLFGYGAYSMARAMTRAGVKAYLYYFSYVDAGKRSALGAFHGEELSFLSDSFPSDWKLGADEARLGELMRAYWTRFATSADPNGAELPFWPAYDTRDEHAIELGRTVKLIPVPHLMQLRVLDQTAQEILADTEKAGR